MFYTGEYKGQVDTGSKLKTQVYGFTMNFMEETKCDSPVWIAILRLVASVESTQKPMTRKTLLDT